MAPKKKVVETDMVEKPIDKAETVKEYTVLSPVKMNGVRYSVGDKLLDPTPDLLESGAVKLIDKIIN